MCGFIGYISEQNNSLINLYEKKFDYYFEKLKNRGPDYSTKKKFIVNNKIINVGFCRLAIQDLSDNANRIFHNENGLLLFNGEIYNKNEIKNKYFPTHSFETRSDTEVLFNFLNTYKFEKIQEIRGIFSIVYFDFKNNKIHCSRDFTGTKPLYYSHQKDNFFFSSEAWFLYSVNEKKLNYSSLDKYLNYGFIFGNETLIKNVHKVLPRSILTYDIGKNQILSDIYLDLSLKKNLEIPTQDFTYNLLHDVIKRNTLSDVKVGTFLSGGVDSTIVTLIAKKFSNLESFTSKYFPEEKYKKFNKDFYYAQKVSDDYNLKLNTTLIHDSDNLIEDFYKVANYFDEPVSNLNFLNLYWQTKKAKELGFKVLLTGDGADEIFCGYDRYKVCYIAEKLKIFSFFSDKINRLNPEDKNLIPEIYYKIFEKNELFKIIKDQNFYLNKTINPSSKNFDNNLDLINFFDTSFWLTDESNYKLDKCTMINSVEARVPYQDLDMIKNFFYIANYKKLNIINQKFILKNLNILPTYIQKRRKIGWFNPEKIFLENNLDKIIERSINKKQIIEQGIFNYDELDKFFASFKQKSYLIKRQLTTILLFQIWYNKLIKLY